MTIGMIFYIIAAIVLFLGGIGSMVIPNPVDMGAVLCRARSASGRV